MTIIVAVPHKLYDPKFRESHQALVQVEVISQHDGVTYFKNIDGAVTAAISTEVFTINMRQPLNGHQANMKPLKEWAVNIRRNGWDQFLGSVHGVDLEEANFAANNKYKIKPEDVVTISER